ncbi:MAG: hypothetical protein PHG69_05915 [Candidatus Omnitrophica bacterium]|nr:hypothetical protein [Candidatus Omnitrophota bacterium]
MKIIEEKSELDYTKIPGGATGEFENHAKVEGIKCLLSGFNINEDSIDLHFENEKHACIKARTVLGKTEIGWIGDSLPDFIGKSYEEILNANFGPKAAKL